MGEEEFNNDEELEEGSLGDDYNPIEDDEDLGLEDGEDSDWGDEEDEGEDSYDDEDEEM